MRELARDVKALPATEIYFSEGNGELVCFYVRRGSRVCQVAYLPGLNSFGVEIDHDEMNRDCDPQTLISERFQTVADRLWELLWGPCNTRPYVEDS
jgi:hypothetical protein